MGSGRWLRGAAFVMNIVVAAPLIQSGDEERLHGAILWVFEIYWPVLNSLGRSIVCCVLALLARNWTSASDATNAKPSRSMNSTGAAVLTAAPCARGLAN